MAERDDLRRMHDEENADFSAYLHSLDPADFERPSLCAGWRVRDVVGHILYGNELNLLSLPWRLGRFGFSSDRSGAYYSRQRAEGRPVEGLVRDFDQRDPWTGSCRIFPPRLVLLDRLAHHQDIRRALDHPREVPPERLLAVLEAAPTLGSVFRGKQRAKGLAFRATDVEWSHGLDRGAPVVEGPGEALFMTLLGRPHPLPELAGDGLPAFRQRVE